MMANHPFTSTYVTKNRPFAIENVDPAQHSAKATVICGGRQSVQPALLSRGMYRDTGQELNSRCGR